MMWGGVDHKINRVGWDGCFMKSMGWHGSCTGGVGHAEVEWGESYRGGVGHAVKQPKKMLVLRIKI